MTTNINSTGVNKNFLSQTGFQLILDKLPTVTYFSQNATLPSISLGRVDIATPLIDYPIAGNKLTFSPFLITFKVDEDMKNFIEIYNWLVGIASPQNLSNNARFKRSNINQSIFSDATLLITSSKYNPNVKVKFQNMFPIELGQLEFATDVADIDYLQSSVQFAYTLYTIEKL
jgi:hypothetical protein